MLKKSQNITMCFTKWISDLDWRLLFLLIPPLSLIFFLVISSKYTNSFSSLAPVKSFFIGSHIEPTENITVINSFNYSTPPPLVNSVLNRSEPALTPTTRKRRRRRRKDQLDHSRIAVCLVGGARRFELTGPSIIENIFKQYPNSDLFLHSPLDVNAFKFSLLKNVPRIASIRIFKPNPVPETESQLRVLTSKNSPNGIQGLLQYFTLVEGCLTMIQEYQKQNNFTYNWIVRTRVDGYWNAPLHPKTFIPGQYLVPPGSSYGGLNDRLGIGDLNTSIVALSRLSLISKLDLAELHQLNSEAAFKAQLTTQGIHYVTKQLPFCIVSDRTYRFPPTQFGVPVAALSSKGPLSGAKCRPCTPVCKGPCVGEVMMGLNKEWSWTHWSNGTMELCDAHNNWEMGLEKTFDRVAGKELADERKRVEGLKMKQCVDDFREMKNRSVGRWEAPKEELICWMGLGTQ